MLRTLLFFAVPLGALAAAAPAAEPHEITVYAAASLRDVLTALTPEGEKAAGVKLVFNFGASNALAKQIEAGNQADVFFSADEASMDSLDKSGLVDSASRRSPLSNHLVVIAPADRAPGVKTVSDLAGPAVRRLSLADPEAVPAGKYAKAWLTKAGVWEHVKDRVVPALDVRAALAAVESGGCEAGIVYRTDAAISKSVRVLFEAGDDAPRISYALAALSKRPGIEDARKVAAWLAGPDAAKTFARFGFAVASSTP
jgi:molybdate transport system substrate-binding protein